MILRQYWQLLFAWFVWYYQVLLYHHRGYMFLNLTWIKEYHVMPLLLASTGNMSFSGGLCFNCIFYFLDSFIRNIFLMSCCTLICISCMGNFIYISNCIAVHLHIPYFSIASHLSFPVSISYLKSPFWFCYLRSTLSIRLNEIIQNTVIVSFTITLCSSPHRMTSNMSNKLVHEPSFGRTVYWNMPI